MHWYPAKEILYIPILFIINLNHTPMKTGLQLTTVLGIIFLILKLTGIIDWSWWWVLFPFYWAFALLMAGLISTYVIAKLTRFFKK